MLRTREHVRSWFRLARQIEGNPAPNRAQIVAVSGALIDAASEVAQLLESAELEAKVEDPRAWQRIVSLRHERDDARRSRRFTRDWYATRWERLGRWARALPQELSHQFFSILANGAASVDESPRIDEPFTPTQIIALQGHRIDELRDLLRKVLPNVNAELATEIRASLDKE